MIEIKKKFKNWETNEYLIESIIDDILWEKIIDSKFENKINSIIQNIIQLTKNIKLTKKFSISVLFTGDNKITNLNNNFRNINSATNVLSFPFIEVHEDMKSLNFLGDIVISCDTLVKEAKKDKIKISDHLIHLFVHSFLHLLGYDHVNCVDAEIMETLEIKILKNLDIKNPYANY